MSNGSPVLQGPLQIRKKKGFEERYFVLSEESLDYYAAQADSAAGGPPRGRLDLEDVEAVERQDGRLAIHSKDRPLIVLQASGSSDGEAWFRELCRLTGGQPEPEASDRLPQASGRQSGAESQGASPTAARQSRERLRQFERGLSLELERAAALWQGSLEVEHKGESKKRFFVLLDDALVYYLQESDWDEGKDPRGAFLLTEIVAFEDSQAEPGFTLRVKGQPKPFRLRAASEADLDMWLRLLREALEHEIGDAFKLHRELDQREEEEDQEAAAEGQPEARKESWVERVSHEHRLKRKLLNAPWSCNGCFSLDNGASTAYACIDGCQFQLCKACHDKAASLRETVARPEALEEETEDAEQHQGNEILCEGYLEHIKGSKQDRKYFVLTEDSFDYFSSREDFQRGLEPRGCIVLEDIVGVEVSVADQGSLVVDLADRRFELRTGGERPREEAEAWGRAWQRALAKRASGETRPPEAAAAREPQVSSPARSQKLLQTTVSISRRGKLESRRAVLSSDRLEFFMDERAVARGEEPRTRVALADVQHFETKEGGWLLLEVSERMVEFHMEQSSLEWEAWRSTLVQLLGEEVAGGAAAAPSVAVETVVEAIDNMLKSRHIRARDLIQDPKYNPSKSLQLDAHGLQQVCAEAGLSVSLADCFSLIGSLAVEGRQELDLGELEGILRSHRRVRTPEDLEREAMRARASLKILKKNAQGGAEERLQQARAGDAAEKARLRLRAASFGCAGVNWAKVFVHYDPLRAGIVDARGFIALVRREAKISAREMPDAMLDKVFALIDKAGNGSIGHSQFLAWLGLQDEADRALQEEHAAVRIQSLLRGRKARTSVCLLKEGCPRRLKKGTFKLQGSDGRLETRALSIYEDRLEFVGRSHGHRIMARDVQDVEVLDRGFLLSIRGGAPIKLFGPPGICMEEWLDAFSRVFAARDGKSAEVRARDWDEDMHWSSDGEGEGEGDPGDSQASYASTAASAHAPGARGRQEGGRGQELGPPAAVLWESWPRTPPEGGGKAKAALAQAPRQSPSPRGRQRTGSPRPGQRVASPRGQAQQRQQSPKGMGDRGLRKAAAAAASPRNITAASRSRSLDRARSPRREATPPRREATPPRREATPPRREATPPRRSSMEPPAAARSAKAKETDTKVFRDPPVHFGNLGFEESGIVVQRYAVLFQDRLDSWAIDLHANTGQPPRGRIAINEVRGIEMVKGGFILNLKGRKVELFVESSDAVSAWSKALHSVVLTRFEPHRPRVRSSSRKRAGDSTELREDFLPRVASLPPPAHQFTPGPGLSPRRGASIFSRPLSRDGVRVNTHKDALQAGIVLHGKDAVALSAGQRHVASKVNERVAALHGRQQEHAEKVTGKLHLTPRRAGELPGPAAKITGKRLLSPRREHQISAKITGEVRAASPQHRCLVAPTALITDVGREPSSRLRSPSPSVTTKIAERSANLGSPRIGGISDLDKQRAFGVSSSHHSSGVSWSWAPN